VIVEFGERSGEKIMTPQNSSTKYYLAQLNTLVGGKVTAVATDEDEEFFGLQITMPDGTRRTILFLSDDEGNGPGSFEIQNA
jgi:hypothetical protein